MILRTCGVIFLKAAAISLVAFVGFWTVNALAIDYSYDSLNRLTNVDYGNGASASYTYDAAGNRLTYSGAVMIDTVEPSIAVTNPTAGATFSTTNGTINLSGTAADNTGVSLVTWENDRGGIGAAAGAESWSIDSIFLQPGANDIWLTAFDLAGNEGYAALTITYTPPVGPVIQTSLSSGSFNLTWPAATAGDFVLQYADSLSPPIAWTNVIATITTNADNLSVMFPTTNAQRFFRLLK